MVNTPCQLWPNHPLPTWLQSPLVIILLLLVGACFGWTAGCAFTHWWHYKIKLLIERYRHEQFT